MPSNSITQGHPAIMAALLAPGSAAPLRVSATNDSPDGYFAHHGLWAPGVRVFRRLGFTAKAIIISLAFLVPLLLVGWLLHNDAQNAMRARMDATRQHGEVAHGILDWAHGEEVAGRISDITGTNDGIAFQTNILALNAAVEAARAGDQGRGFAVVAAEVRALAQRSAEAARQIKRLIDESVAQVEAGTGIVQRAGSTIEEIVAASQRVDALLGQIANGARDQGAGIGRIGTAIEELERMTQQNAARVEQTAAASAAMNEQAHGLVEGGSHFHLR
jgi:methyl-accepting chemotaxis protein